MIMLIVVIKMEMTLKTSGGGVASGQVNPDRGKQAGNWGVFWQVRYFFSFLSQHHWTSIASPINTWCYIRVQKQCGFPCVVKPNRGSGCLGVTKVMLLVLTNVIRVLVDSNRSLTMLFVDQVNSRKEIKEAVDLAFKQDSQVFFSRNCFYIFSTTNFLQHFF